MSASDFLSTQLQETGRAVAYGDDAESQLKAAAEQIGAEVTIDRLKPESPLGFMAKVRPSLETITLYVHGGPEASDESSDLWPHDAPQQSEFHYCLYEEPVEIEVDIRTGKWRYLSFGGVLLTESKWNPGGTDKP